MPKNTTIILVRHAEKPATGTGLAPAGQMRAQAYAVFFQNYAVNGQNLKFNYLFASKDSENSDRPMLTVTPFSKASGLTIDVKYKDKDFQKIANHIQQHSKYDNSSILICWHHGELLALAAALGVNAAQLPASACWPAKWHGSVFGWTLKIVYDANGNIVNDQVTCTSEKLMYDDYGQVPPGTDLKS